MARLRRPVAVVGGVPAEVADQQAPLWCDVHALEAHPIWGDYVDDVVRERLRFGGRAYHVIVGRWALTNGYESTSWPRTVDWHALRAALGE